MGAFPDDEFPPGKSGGLIEAVSCATSRTPAPAGFRRVNPAASLKRSVPRVQPYSPVRSSFRRVNPAASLKPQKTRGGRAQSVAGFRRVNPAASLKPGRRPVGRRHGEAGFPPGKSGGLIEASRFTRISRPAPRWFPPGKSGGLIEARTPGVAGRALRSCFRRVNPAASLKPIRSLPRWLLLVGFRRVNPAASLKRLRFPLSPRSAAPVSAG